MARFYNPSTSGGGSGDTADFIFTNVDVFESSMVVSNKDMIIETTRDDSETDADINIDSADDIFITANGDDITLTAADEIRMSSGGTTEISTGAGATWQFGNGGGLDLPGNGNIFNPTNSSGDGLGLSTIELTPDLSVTNDRYIVIDPTQPDHIHIRAGGAIDASNAKLIIGGEQTHVSVVDSDHEVFVKTTGPIPVVNLVNTNSTTPSDILITSVSNNVNSGWVVYDGQNKTGNMATVTNVVLQGSFPSEEYVITVDIENFFISGNTYYFYDEVNTQENNWVFGDDGYLYGPAMGLIKAIGFINEDSTGFLGLAASNHVIIQATNGVFLNDASNNANQVATMGDLPTGATGTFTSADGKTITVNDGIITAITS